MLHSSVTQFNQDLLIGINHDIWTTDSVDTTLIRGDYNRLPEPVNIKYVVDVMHREGVVTLGTDGYVYRDEDVVSAGIKDMFALQVGDNDDVVILEHGGVLKHGMIHTFQEFSNIVMTGVVKIYPMSLHHRTYGIQPIDSILVEEANQLRVMTLIRGKLVTVKEMPKLNIISVKRGTILTSNLALALRLKGDRTIDHDYGVSGVKDAINHISPNGDNHTLLMYNDGRVTDIRGNQIGSGFDRFIHFLYGRGIFIVGKDEKTYILNIHPHVSLEDLDIPLVLL